MSAEARRVLKVCPRKSEIVMVGMHLTKTRGGITTLAASILGSRLSEKCNFTYIESQAEELGKFRKLLLALEAALRFSVACLTKRPEAAYIHVGSNASLYRESAFLVLARLLGRRTICHFHAGDVGKYLPVQTRLGQWFIRWALGHSHRIIAVSNESASELAEIVETADVSVLPNAIDLSWLDAPTFSDDGRDSDKKIRVLFVGAVGKLKGEKDLIDALALLRKTKVDIKASFLGYGAEQLAEACTRAGIIEMIEHLGPVPMSERADHYKKADIFVLPTYAEAMPVSLLEAMAAGLPVITTPVGGIPEIVENGKEGILYPCGDVQSLADGIKLLIEDPAARIRMGESGKQRAAEQLNFDKYIHKLEIELEAVLDESA